MFQWVHSYVTDDKIYCVYIAPDEAAVRKHAQMGDFPANSVSEIRSVIDPAYAVDGLQPPLIGNTLCGTTKMSPNSLLGPVIAVAVCFVLGCQPNCADLVIPPAEDSPYVLPYPVGEGYVVSQSYCNPRGGHRNRIAVDFMMPMGAQITASRSGEVIAVVETFVDGDLRRGNNNRLLIRHEDGTVAWYAHLQLNSVVVDVGERVVSGQPVARCGNTGNTGNLPHLHFEVFRKRIFDYSDALPIPFRNAGGVLDSRGGLVAGNTYEALDGRP